MGAQENKERIRQAMDEIWKQGKLDKIEDYFAPDYVEHTPYGDLEGHEGLRGFAHRIRGTYDDFRLTAENVVADDELVAYNYTVEGIHAQRVGDLEPTYNRIRVGGVYLGRFQNGKVVEAWNTFDVMGLLIQLGVISPPSFLKARQQQVHPTPPSGPESARPPL